jgi:ethanolamine-phosphate cytidylyltransferase
MAAGTPGGKKLRIWLDGCYDMMHWGHANVLRQAREAVGGNCHLVLGIHSDAEIARHKGPCIMNETERYPAARAVKWVDEVVEDVPYCPTLPLLREHQIDLVIHGDDVAVDASGRNAYEEIIAAGMFKTVPRTDGVSTTDLIERMLYPDRTDHFFGLKRSMLSSRRVVEFAAGNKCPAAADKVVYVDGAFDIFHIGHIELLRKAKELGSHLIVGLHDDKTINEYKGRNYPIMNLHERVLGILSCRYVDEVIIGAPWAVTKDMIQSMHIQFVVHGKRPVDMLPGHQDPYAEAKAAGVYTEVDSGNPLTTSQIVERVVRRHQEFLERNRKKIAHDGTSAPMAQ